MKSSDIYNAAHRIIGTSELAIKNTTVNQTIIAEGRRDFSWVWMIVFIIFVWPGCNSAEVVDIGESYGLCFSCAFEAEERLIDATEAPFSVKEWLVNKTFTPIP